MARTNKYHSSEIKRKRKPSPFTFGKRGLFMPSDLVMYCSLLLCYIFVILSNTSPVDAKLTITGSGGYSSRRIHLDLSDGGYKGIVVKINKDVPEKYCPTILSNIKGLFRQSSVVLHKSLNENVFFKSVTIVVPSTWRDGKCQEMIRPPQDDVPYREADIKVTLDHPIYKAAPHTQQSRQCGMRGDFINLPYSFLNSWNETKETWGEPAKVFVHEWMKLRYGIFDEFGFTGDSMYPNYFHHNGQILPTGTSNLPLKGLWLNSNGETGCHPGIDRDCFYHLQGRNDGITCSLGYLHFLPNVTSYCDKNSLHSEKSAPMSPTKHNILCNGKSAREVIESNVDLKLLASYRKLFTAHKFEPFSSSKTNMKTNHIIPTVIRQHIEPKFHIVREPLEQYILVMETSSSMDDHDQWKWINKAAQKFIRYDLPVNSNLGIVTFSNTSKVEHSMVQVHSDQVRARLADTIPDKYHLSRSEKRCVLCSLQKVLHEVVRDNHAGTHIILITQGSADTLSLTDEAVIEGYVLDHNIKMSTILLPETGTNSYLPFYDSVSTLMNGKTYIVKNNKHIIDFYVRLNEAFADILRSDARYPTEIPELVYKQEFVGDKRTSSTVGNFLIDSTLGRDTQFGIYVEDEEEHLIKAITFKDSKGKRYGPFTRMSSSFDLVNFKTINFPAGQAPPFNAPHQIGMTWQYDIEWHNGGNRKERQRTIIDLSTSNSRERMEGGNKKEQSDMTNSSPNYGGNTRMNVVVVTSKPRSQTAGNLITTHTWTSMMEKEDTKQPTPYPNILRNKNISYTHQNLETNNTIPFAEERIEMKPLAIYTQVLRGASPILKAKVMLTIIVEQANGSIVTLPSFELKDDGYGDPDLVEGDGIYSRYLGHHTLSGRYKFIVTIDDNDNQAFYVSNTNTLRAAKNSNHYNNLVLKRKMLMSQRQQQINSQGGGPKSSTFKRDIMALNEQQLIPNYANIMLQVTRNRCCGSSVLPSLQLNNFPQKAVKTGIFRRKVDGPVIHVDYQREGVAQEDVLPPAKIGDLKIIRLPNTSDKLLASWTAPGGDFDFGSVSSYRFVYSENIQDLIEEENQNAKILLGFERMEKAGTKAKFDFSFPYHDQDYYIAAYAFDLAGNRGKISNLVHVKLPAPPSAGGILGEGKPYGGQDTRSTSIFDSQSETNWIMIGAIAGVIFVLLILGLAVISYYFAVARKRSKGKTGSTSSVMNGGSSDETDSSSFDSDIKNIMANPLGPSLPLPSAHSHSASSQKYLPRSQPSSQIHHQYTHSHHSQHYNGIIGQGVGHLSSANTTPSDQPPKTNSTNVTPVYWSASQLLSKLDQPVQGNGLAQYSQNYGNPYVNAVQTDVYSINDLGDQNGGLAYAPHGPHSLQPMLSPSSLLSHHHQHHQQQHPMNGGLLSVGGHNQGQAQHGPNSLHNVSFADTRSYAMLHNNNQDWSYHTHPSSVANLSSAQSAMDSPSHHHCNHPDIPEEYTITVGNLNGGGLGSEGDSSVVAGVIDSPTHLSETPVPKPSSVNTDTCSLPQSLSQKPRNITQV